MYVSRLTLAGSLALRIDGPRASEIESANLPDFLRNTNRSLKIDSRADAELRVPIAVTQDDLAGFYASYQPYSGPPLGRVNNICRVVRQNHKYVFALRGLEGIIFDAEGFIRDSGFFAALPQLPPGLSRRGDVIEIDAKLLRDAIYISEPMIISCNGNAHNYYHTLIESAVSLDLLQSCFNRRTRIFFPDSLEKHTDVRHRELLERMGYAPSRLAEAGSGVVLAEEVIWLENYYIEETSADRLRAFRERMRHNPKSRRQTPKRVYISRHSRRSAANPDELESCLRDFGIESVDLEKLSISEQIDIFQNVEMVVGPHGAGLANILFCPAGTRVIELYPSCEFRPFFWMIANKLNLRYGVVSCASSAFNNPMIVNVENLRNLIRLFS